MPCYSYERHFWPAFKRRQEALGMYGHSRGTRIYLAPLPPISHMLPSCQLNNMKRTMLDAGSENYVILRQTLCASRSSRAILSHTNYSK